MVRTKRVISSILVLCLSLTFIQTPVWANEQSDQSNISSKENPTEQLHADAMGLPEDELLKMNEEKKPKPRVPKSYMEKMKQKMTVEEFEEFSKKMGSQTDTIENKQTNNIQEKNSYN